MCQMSSGTYPSLLPDSVLALVWKFALPTEPVVNICQCCLAQLNEDVIGGSDITHEKGLWEMVFHAPFLSFELALRKSTISTEGYWGHRMYDVWSWPFYLRLLRSLAQEK